VKINDLNAAVFFIATTIAQLHLPYSAAGVRAITAPFDSRIHIGLIRQIRHFVGQTAYMVANNAATLSLISR